MHIDNFIFTLNDIGMNVWWNGSYGRQMHPWSHRLFKGSAYINPLNAKLNPICHLLALLGSHLILHVSRI